jgi:hypothetical protein
MESWTVTWYVGCCNGEKEIVGRWAWGLLRIVLGRLDGGLRRRNGGQVVEFDGEVDVDVVVDQGR